MTNLVSGQRECVHLGDDVKVTVFEGSRQCSDLYVLIEVGIDSVELELSEIGALVEQLSRIYDTYREQKP
jgi:hypothetical protein